jgi:hypothetical protein
VSKLAPSTAALDAAQEQPVSFAMKYERLTH